MASKSPTPGSPPADDGYVGMSASPSPAADLPSPIQASAAPSPEALATPSREGSAAPHPEVPADPNPTSEGPAESPSAQETDEPRALQALGSPPSNYVFNSMEEAKECVDQYAIENGFAVAIKASSSRTLDSGQKEKIAVYLWCNRSRPYRPKEQPKDGTKQRRTNTTTTNCPFRVAIYRRVDPYTLAVNYMLSIDEWRHNHPSTSLSAHPRYRRHTLNKFATMISTQLEYGVPPRLILEGLHDAGASYIRVHDIYNFQQQKKHEKPRERKEKEDEEHAGGPIRPSPRDPRLPKEEREFLQSIFLTGKRVSMPKMPSPAQSPIQATPEGQLAQSLQQSIPSRRTPGRPAKRPGLQDDGSRMRPYQIPDQPATPVQGPHDERPDVPMTDSPANRPPARQKGLQIRFYQGPGQPQVEAVPTPEPMQGVQGPQHPPQNYPHGYPPGPPQGYPQAYPYGYPPGPPPGYYYGPPPGYYYGPPPGYYQGGFQGYPQGPREAGPAPPPPAQSPFHTLQQLMQADAHQRAWRAQMAQDAKEGRVRPPPPPPPPGPPLHFPHAPPGPPAEEPPAEDAPVEGAAAEEPSTQEAPAQEVPVQEAPAEEASAQKSPSQASPAPPAATQEAPAQDDPAPRAPAQASPAQASPAQAYPAEVSPAPQESPAQASQSPPAPSTLKVVQFPPPPRTSPRTPRGQYASVPNDMTGVMQF